MRVGVLERLARTNCKFVAPGIEAWNDYSKKAGAQRTIGRDKLDRVVEQFEALSHSIPYMQANFMFGLDCDAGDEPIELTKEFMTRTPYVWPVVNISHPFGDTPMQAQFLREGRILKRMPFSFYYSPYVVTTIKNYDPLTYYRRLREGACTKPCTKRRRRDGHRDSTR